MSRFRYLPFLAAFALMLFFGVQKVAALTPPGGEINRVFRMARVDALVGDYNFAPTNWYYTFTPIKVWLETGSIHRSWWSGAVSTWTGARSNKLANLQWLNPNSTTTYSQSESQVRVFFDVDDMAAACGNVNATACFAPHFVTTYDSVREVYLWDYAYIFIKDSGDINGSSGYSAIFRHEIGHVYGLDDRYLIATNGTVTTNTSEVTIMDAFSSNAIGQTNGHIDGPFIMAPTNLDMDRAEAYWFGVEYNPEDGYGPPAAITPEGPNGRLDDWSVAHNVAGGPYMDFQWNDFGWEEYAHYRQMQKKNGDGTYSNVGPQIVDTRLIGMHWVSVDGQRRLWQTIDAGPGPSGPALSLNTGPGTYRMCGEIGFRAAEPSHNLRLNGNVTCSDDITVSF